jgi:hypothetical protein
MAIQGTRKMDSGFAAWLRRDLLLAYRRRGEVASPIVFFIINARSCATCQGRGGNDLDNGVIGNFTLGRWPVCQ